MQEKDGLNALFNKEVEKNKRSIKKDLKDLGIYKKSFDCTIEQLSNLLYFHQKANDALISSGLVITKEGRDGEVYIKNPYYQIVEKSRMDILNYLRELGLTPQSLKKLRADSFDDKKEESALISVLRDIG